MKKSVNSLRSNKIDFLRGVAILLVLILHFNLSYDLTQSALTYIFPVKWLDVFVNNGNYGVTLFFAISGFLITSTTLERYGSLADINPLGFYIFRFARIMPCLLLVLGVIAFFSSLHIPIFQNNANSVSLPLAIFSVLTFWHNVLMEKAGYFNYCLNIYWSLSVEEVFYLSFPLVCLVFKKTRLMVLFLASLILIAPVVRSHYINDEIVALYGYFSCFDAIALGCLAAILAKKMVLSVWQRKVCLLSSAAVMMGVYFYSNIMENVVLGVSFMAISAAVFLLSASAETAMGENSHHFFGRVIRWFGKNSYELYLFHIIVLACMNEIMVKSALNGVTKLLWMAVFIGVSALLAGVIATCYSQPMNKKLRDFLLGISFFGFEAKGGAHALRG